VCRTSKDVVDIRQSRSLVGEHVEIRIDNEESGIKDGIDAIVGTIFRSVRDREGGVYWVVEAGVVPQDKNEADRHSRLASYFLVTPKAQGETLERAFEMHNDELAVAVGEVLDLSVLNSEFYDFPQARFFAIGYLGFIRNCSEPPG